ncbi:MAG: hypothetical protein MJZ33_02120 [Paludibacteraceae bacterium]|nr:hypothetical protein [Paludibacteraceae bacterium]
MKTKKMLYVNLLALLSVVLKSCITLEAPIYCIHLKNKTEDELFTIYRWSSDDTFTKVNKLSEDSSWYITMKTDPNWAPTLWCFGDRPEDFLKPTDTLTIFILDKEEYEGKAWSQLADSAHFRQIYHLSGDDVRQIGSKIPYPPSDVMRYMDMEPPYEEAVRN